jgi:Protein of unknown function (DUF3307)
MFEILAWMLIGHAVCDFPFQSEWMAKAKDPTRPLIAGETIWPVALAAHAGLHAGAVRIATGSWVLAACEFIAHSGIDYLKCEGRFTFNQDQGLHVLCKLVWLMLLMTGIVVSGHAPFPP